MHGWDFIPHGIWQLNFLTQEKANNGPASLNTFTNWFDILNRAVNRLNCQSTFTVGHRSWCCNCSSITSVLAVERPSVFPASLALWGHGQALSKPHWCQGFQISLAGLTQGPATVPTLVAAPLIKRWRRNLEAVVVTRPGSQADCFWRLHRNANGNRVSKSCHILPSTPWNGLYGD